VAQHDHVDGKIARHDPVEARDRAGDVGVVHTVDSLWPG
jgi:hypothetical protein